MSDSPIAALDELERLRFTFDRRAARAKASLLDRLESVCLGSAEEVERLHEALCFIRAYPDDRPVLTRVRRMLAGFASREDLDRHREELFNSGIAGTEIYFPFFWFTLSWLASRWPERLRIDWGGFGARKKLLDRRLSALLPYCETTAIEEATMTTREWIDYLKGPDETDAVFVVRRFQALRADPLPRESIFEEMDVPFRLSPGPDTPSNTHNVRDRSAVAYQKRPLDRSRDHFHRDLGRPPKSVRTIPAREARELIDMARFLMVVRVRDLDAFVHASEDDVRILDYGHGLEFVCYGTAPERRQMFDAAYGFLMLRNGTPIGYVLSAALFESAEVAFNVSPAFRGAEAAYLYARALNMVRELFGAETMMVDPYQMGHENPEGLRSGAWWFYYKLGFRPRDETVKGLVARELEKMKARPGYRSSMAKLNRLSSVNMYLHLGAERDDVIGEFSRENIGLHVVAYLARRFGSDRERGIEICTREAARLLGLRSLAGFSAGERLAWDRWAPVVLQLPGVEGWPASAKAAAARVVRAKGGKRESDFVRLFDKHRRLRNAIFSLSEEPPERD